jgi:hypothetical protein
MTKRLMILAIGCAIGVVFWIGCAEQPAVAPANPSRERFPSADQNHVIPANWNGPTFELSQDYPHTEPKPEHYAWEEIDFTQEPKRYLTEIGRYVYEGNIEVDWVVQNNRVRQWFHAPWMHAPEIKGEKEGRCRDEKGREFIRGLTRERSSTLAELNFGKDPTQCTNDIENWAVSIYNPPGGFVVGQVWDEMTIHSRSERFPDPKNFPKDFPIGTVIAKLLFTTASPTLVPYLAGSPEVQADIKRTQTPVTLRLLQVDIAVRDRRAEFDALDKTKMASGWVFATYTYAKDSLLFDDGSEKTLPWRRLKPIGLMYGNERRQTILVDTTIPLTQHLGCDQRLAGPVDNPSSSCLACHALAEVNGEEPFQRLNQEPNGKKKYDQCRCQDDVNFWFRTLSPGEAFTPKAVSLHFSLQLSNGILRYCDEHPEMCLPDGQPTQGSVVLKPCPIKIFNTCPNQPSPNEPACPMPSPSPSNKVASDTIINFGVETARGGDVENPEERTVKAPKKKTDR